jgi:hypothetical protein
MAMQITQVDVLYVAQQINKDLTALSKAYPKILAMDRAMDLFNASVTFLANYAVSEMGYSVHHPNDNKLVYLDLQYQVARDGIDKGNKGGYLIDKIQIPHFAKFTPWVVWSSTMFKLSEDEQKQIVSGTGWNMPDGMSQRCYWGI